MKLTYIYHSCYLIENVDYDIVIDYYEDSQASNLGLMHDRILPSDKLLYVLSTHSHHDHFNPTILEWKKHHPNIKYIFSKDILAEGLADRLDATYLDKGEVFKDDKLSIKAFGSTDIGGSFLINDGVKLVFHAGDLNNWHWNEESPAQESREYEENFLNELGILYADAPKLDLALFPIDPRLGKDYMRGAEQFLSKIEAKILAPMHFHDAYDKTEAFRAYAESKGCKLFSPTSRGESINL